MLQLSGSFVNKAVLSLRTGGVVGQITSPIVNPNNLKIEGFFCQDRFHKERTILLAQDIRENSPKGFVINDQEVLSDPDDLVRLKPIIDLHFELLGKPITTVTKSRLGKVTDYAVDGESMYIQKLYAGQSLLKSFSGGQLSIDRSQLVEITDRKIVIQDPLQPLKDSARTPASAPA